MGAADRGFNFRSRRVDSVPGCPYVGRAQQDGGCSSAIAARIDVSPMCAISTRGDLREGRRRREYVLDYPVHCSPRIGLTGQAITIVGRLQMMARWLPFVEKDAGYA